MNERENQDNYEELIKAATEQAKKKLEGVIKPEQLGYQGFLEMEIEKILKEKGIEWQPLNKGTSIDQFAHNY